MTPPAAGASLRFGRFELQAHERRLLMDGAPVPLGARALDLLLALAERPGRLVGKRMLLELVWPGLVVQDNNLAAQMSALRKVIGNDVIATVPGRGYRFVARLDAAHAPPSAGDTPHVRPAPTHLPAELTPLLGRGADLDALLAQLDAQRLVTLVGPGGVGKSLLAQHALQARRRAYAQGVCWVELGALRDAAALPGAILGALGVHDGGHGDPMSALRQALAPLSMLLALDNAEHLLADVAQLCQALHAHCPQLRIVVTSQAPLKVAAEQVLRIEPLTVPDPTLPAAQAMHFGAVALFVQRAQALDPRFVLRDHDVATVIALCRALDGLPLAIELAAARMPLLGLVQLQAAIERPLQLLTVTHDRTAPPRQHTLRAALEWSHALLDMRERVVFRRLGVVIGSAPLALIQQLVADDDGGALDAWAVLDALDALVERSLLTVLPGDDVHEPRYRLLEAPRAFALERLADSGEQARMRQRHAQAIGAWCDAAYDLFFSGAIGCDAWIERMGLDLDNAREGLAWARANGDAATELTLAATLLRALPPSLHAERMALAESCEATLSHADVAPALRQRVWIEISCACADTQKHRARDAAGRALEQARRLDATQADRFVLYHALSRAASAAAQAGDLASARAALAEALTHEDPAWPAQRLLWGAEAAQVIARMSGDADDTLRRSRRLVALDRARGSDASIALGNLIDHELAAGDAQAAVQTGRTLVATLQGTRNEYSLAFARINLCAACLALGDCPQARAVAQAAWPQAMAFDLQHAAASYLTLLAALEGRARAAAMLAGYARALYVARDEVPEANEAAALQRAEALGRRALGEAAWRQACTDGAGQHERAIAALAFAHVDG